MLIKIEICYFFLLLIKSRFFEHSDCRRFCLENFDWNRDFFHKIDENRNFSSIVNWMVNFNVNWDVWKIVITIEIFENYCKNGDFRKALTKIDIFNSAVQNQDFAAILSKLMIFQNYYHNQDAPKISTKFKISANIEQYRNFWKYWQKSKFYNICSTIGIFRKKIWTKSIFFDNFDKNRDFPEISTKITINKKIDQKQDFR